MRIVIDENISFAQEAFSGLGEVVLLPGRSITNQHLINADALITRSVTKVDEKLLANTSVKFVGTSTIGTDHIDTKLLASKNISFADAAGCNADAVTEYVFTSIFSIAARYNINLAGLKLGVIGAGNIGSRVVKLGNILGLNVFANDPPLKRRTKNNDYKELTELLDADIITLHVPLNMGGLDNTFHLMDEKLLSSLKDGCIIINASRGEVVDNKILIDLITKKIFLTVLDVWENEPDINTNLLEKVIIGSPHIAGYSFEGKVNGTKIIYDALCKFLNVQPVWVPSLPEVENNIIELTTEKKTEDLLNEIFSKVYNIVSDDKNMRNLISLSETEKKSHFDLLRKIYPFRREFNNYNIKMNFKNSELKKILSSFRFKVT